MVGQTPLNTQMLVMGLSRITKSAKGNSVAYTEITVEEKDIDDISLIANYPNLHHVNLAGNSLRDVRPLSSLPDLLTLDLSHNQLEEALDLGGVTSNNLSRVILSNNRINSLAALEPHVHLLTLILADNEIASLAPLEALTQLRYLDASGNHLTSVEGMCGQPIQELHLSGNSITSLTGGVGGGGIGSLKSLQVVTLNKNKLKSLSPLDQCDMLTAVEAEHNNLELEAVVTPLQGLTYLRHLRLAGNPAETGMVMPGQSMSQKYKDMPLPDFRRLVYRWRVIYRLLRIESLDGTSVAPEEKVASANFCGADRDAHDHCYNKYFPKEEGAMPMRGRELTITRLHRPEPYVEGELLFPDVWIHRVVQRSIELDYQVVRLEGSFEESVMDPSEDCVGLELEEPTRLLLCMGVTNSSNLGVQKTSSSVALITKEDLPWRVRQIHSSFDHTHTGMALLTELQQIGGGFFGDPPPRQGLRGDEEGYVTAGVLLDWFEKQLGELGEKAVEEVVWSFEKAIDEMGYGLGQPSTVTYLESGHSKVMATVEGKVEPGSYQVASRCSLSEQGALEKASGGEPYFLIVLAEKPFVLNGVSSVPMAEQQDTFSTSFNRPLSRMQMVASRQSVKSAGDSLGPKPPVLNEALALGRYSSREEADGVVALRSLEIFKDGTCQLSAETYPADGEPSFEAEWIDGSWGIDGEHRLVVEGVSDDGSAAAVACLTAIGDRPSRFPAGFEEESFEAEEGGRELAKQYFAPRWLSHRQYKEEHKEEPFEHQREAYGATQTLNRVIEEEPESP